MLYYILVTLSYRQTIQAKFVMINGTPYYFSSPQIYLNIYGDICRLKELITSHELKTISILEAAKAMIKLKKTQLQRDNPMFPFLNGDYKV